MGVQKTRKITTLLCFEIMDSHDLSFLLCCCDCMSVFMHGYACIIVCGCVPGVQLGGRCCWHGRWMYFVRVTGSVVGLAVFWVGVLHIIVKELVLLYVRLYV